MSYTVDRDDYHSVQEDLEASDAKVAKLRAALETAAHAIACSVRYVPDPKLPRRALAICNKALEETA